MKKTNIQYHSNIGKEAGRDYFQNFVAAIREASGPELRVENGTYGNIQRMRNVSNDGPFTHMFEW